MRYLTRSILPAVCLLITGMTMNCLSAEITGTHSSEDDPVRVVCFLPAGNGLDIIRSQILRGLEKTAAEYPELQYSIYTGSDFELSNFQDVLTVFSTMQADYLISFGDSSGASALSSAFIREHALRVILLDNDVPDPDDRIAFIGTDSSSAAELIYSAVSENDRTSKAAVFITHVHEATESRLDALEKIERDSEAFTISAVCYLSSDRITSSSEMSAFLEENPEIDTILCLDGYSSDTAARMLPGIEQEYFVSGFDVTAETAAALKAGDFDVLITQEYSEMGRQAMAFALNWQDGDPHQTVLTSAAAYFPAEADTVLSLLPEEYQLKAQELYNRRFDDEAE